MADLKWLSEKNLTALSVNASNGDTLVLDRMEAFGQMGQTILIVLYTLVTFLAFTGNTLVILVELYGKRSARNLQKFLINLAISDLLIGVLAVPFIYTDIMLVSFAHHLLVITMLTGHSSTGPVDLLLSSVPDRSIRPADVRSSVNLYTNLHRH